MLFPPGPRRSHLYTERGAHRALRAAAASQSGELIILRVVARSRGRLTKATTAENKPLVKKVSIIQHAPFPSFFMPPPPPNTLDSD